MWIVATERKEWQPEKNDRICSKHFESRYFRKTHNRTYLLPNAIPTLFIPDIIDERPCTTKQLKIVEPGLEESTVQHTCPSTINMPKNVEWRMEEIAVEQPSTSKKTKHSEPVHEGENTIPSVLPSSELVETPRKRKLRKILCEKTRLADTRKKKIAVLRSRAWRLKKTAVLSTIIEELKARLMISEESAERLSSIGSKNKDFFKRLISKETAERKCSAELRKFALTLHFISPRAYDYVTRWYEGVDGNPGFSKESFHAIKLLNRANSIKNPLRKLLCALSFDEMAIRKSVCFDGKDCVGFVDCGNNLNSGQLAKDALVFMLMCVNGSWKIPLGYFLINGISADKKANLVKTCIEKVHVECGIDVISVAFDECPTNFAMAKILGCKLEDEEIDPSFCIGDKNVVIFPDPSHMLKLVRNALGQKGRISDRHGRTISWGYIKLLVDLQENEGLHLGNKLTRLYENFSKQIMKVKLAAQTFSNSVADAIY